MEIRYREKAMTAPRINIEKPIDRRKTEW